MGVFRLLITSHRSPITWDKGYGGVGRGWGVGRGLGVTLGVGVTVGVGLGVGVTEGVGDTEGVGVGVGIGPPCAQYLPPVFKVLENSPYPPHTIISVPVHTAV